MIVGSVPAKVGHRQTVMPYQQARLVRACCFKRRTRRIRYHPPSSRANRKSDNELRVGDAPPEETSIVENLIEIRDLHFAYGKRNILNGINLSIPKGKVVA